MPAATSDLEQAEALLDELVLTLQQEREAIVTLDADGVSRATADKEALMRELRATIARGGGASCRTAPVCAGARRVYELAIANAALLEDARGAMEAVLGVPARSTTYDRHARPGLPRAARPLVLVRSVG